MTIRLVPVKSFNNPNLPIGDFSSILKRPEALGVYEMLGAGDASGNGKSLKMGGHTFGPLGMITKSVSGYYADTGIMEPDVYTVVVAHFIQDAATGPAGSIPNIVSSFSEVAAPFSGSRLAMTAANAIHVAAGKTVGSPVQTSSTGTVHGRWTAYAYTINGLKITLQLADGRTIISDGAAGDIKNSAKRTICIAGNPTTDFAGGAVTVPPNGTIGCVGIYSGDPGVGGRAQLINDATTIMKRRGAM